MLENRALYRIKLDYFHGACPTQGEGETDDGFSVYVRYRHGILRVDIAGVTIFRKYCGDDLDGVMNFEELKIHTKGVIEWQK